MKKQQFYEYALHTPTNSNKNVMDSMLEGVCEDDVKERLYAYLIRQNESINPAVLKTWVDNVFKNFGAGATYTVRIDQSDKNPLTCCVYMDDAVGMEKGSSAWDEKEIFRSIKPCMFKNGEVQYYLNPDDFQYDIDGNEVSTEKRVYGADGDMMIEFGKFAYRIYDEDNYVYVSISNDAETIAKDPKFSYLPFTRNELGDCEKIYIGAYLGRIDNGKLRSLQGVPTAEQTIGQFRTAAQANGEGYEQYTFYQHTMLQCLYLIRYGNLNGQAALGKGYTEAEEAGIVGTTFNVGMYHGNPEDGTVHVKFAGIEDFYGNLGQFTDGIYCSDTYHAMAATTGFNDIASGYTDLGAIGVDAMGGIIETIWGDTALGFIPKTYVTEGEMTENSFEENYSDYAGVGAGGLAVVGAFFDSGAVGGPFYLVLGAPAGFAVPVIGARLSFYK